MTTEPQTVRARPRWSLRLKLTLYMTAVALVIQTLLGAIVLYYQYQAIDGFFSSRLNARTDAIVSELRRAGFRVTDEDLGRIVRLSPRVGLFESLAATLYAPDGDAVASTVRPPPALETLAPPGHASSATFRKAVPGVFGGATEKIDSRLTVRHLEGENGRLLVLVLVAGDWSYNAMAAVMLRVFAIASAVGIFAWGVAAWLIADLAMAPLRHLRLVAGSFSPESIERDIELSTTSTEVAALEQDLRESRSKLRSALHAQDRFISSVSHELNTPIAVLLTEAQTLRPDELSPEARAFALSVTEEMQRLGRMVGSFLILTKLRGGQGLTLARPCLINDVVTGAVQACGKMAARYHVTVALRLAEGDPPLTVCGDAELLQLMLENLLRNAIRFSPEGRQVLVHVAPAGPHCQITVQDHGRGVPDSMIGTLFDRSTEPPADEPRGRGHGLGLSVAQGIAELHAGEITVRNLLKEGCEFAIRLPLAPLPTPAQPDPCSPA